jgi:hypothetical protein
MKKLWLSTSVALALAAILASPSEAAKGKGGGKGSGGGKSAAKDGGSAPSGNNGSQSREPSHAQPAAVDLFKTDSKSLQLSDHKRMPKGPARAFDHPNSGNSLPQEVRDKLPPGLRDMPENHPGLANHLRKMGVLKDYPKVDPIPPEVRGQLPPGLRDRPYDHPGVANHLGKLGWSINEDGALVPPPNFTPGTLTPPTQGATPFDNFQPFNGFFRRTLR